MQESNNEENGIDCGEEILSLYDAMADMVHRHKIYW